MNSEAKYIARHDGLSRHDHFHLLAGSENNVQDTPLGSTVADTIM